MVRSYKYSCVKVYTIKSLTNPLIVVALKLAGRAFCLTAKVLSS